MKKILKSVRGFNLLSVIDSRVISLDEAYFSIRLKSQSGKTKLFHDGWGDIKALEYVKENWHAENDPSPAQICWEASASLSDGVVASHGTFTSTRYARWMEDQCARVSVLYVRPKNGVVTQGVLIAPTSRETGFKLRLKIAKHLAKRGIGCILLDNPFMGERKPTYQIGTVIGRLSDYPLMAAACIEENRSILQWMRDQGMTKICATGVSQGGFTSAVAGMKMDFPLHVVSVVPPNNSEEVVAHGIPGRLCDWDALKKTCPGGNVRDELKKVFAWTSLDQISVPNNGTRITLIAAKKDKYVPSTSYDLLADRWKDVGHCEWRNCGHVATILDKRYHLKAIMDTMNG